MMKNFDIDKHEIINNQTVLLEASAGTGKTYSLAVLFVKALLEVDHIRQILAVTYTEAATEELKSRIREFITLLEQKDEKIIKHFPTPLTEEQKKKLQQAIANIDEAQVYTIHGFCNQLLDKYAVEIQFDKTAVLDNDDKKLIHEISFDYYKNTINKLDANTKNVLGVNTLKSIAENVLAGREYAVTYGELDLNIYKNYFSNIKKFPKEFEKKRLEGEYDNAGRYLKAQLEKFIYNKSEPDYFGLYQSMAAKDAGYKQKFCESYSPIEFITNENYVFIESSLKIIDFIPYFKAQYHQQKEKVNTYTYDEMIDFVYHSINDEIKGTEAEKKLSKELAQKIGKEYQFAFIDEFQDTDEKQYKIFEKCFIDNNKGVYLIGDPKQAIYGFRGADIDMYLKAKSRVEEENRFTLTTNYRSTGKFIDKQNNLFESIDNFFLKGNEIEYVHVDPKKEDGEESDGIYFQPFDKEKDNNQNILEQILKIEQVILSQKNKEKPEKERLKYSDIVVLTRTGYGADGLIPLLDENRINSVHLKDENVLKSKEASFVKSILEAFINPDRKNMNIAIYLSFLNEYDLDKYDAKEEQDIYSEFLSWRKSSEQGEIYRAFRKLIRYFSIGNEQTNIEHIAQILQEQQSSKRLDTQGCLTWLKEQMKDGSSTEFNVHLSSDEDAVQIMTIHKAKGLEFKYVFVIGGESLRSPTANNANISRYKKRNKNVFILKSGITASERKIIVDYINEEARRLLYVGITRASKACFIYPTKDKYLKQGDFDGGVEISKTFGQLLPLPEGFNSKVIATQNVTKDKDQTKKPLEKPTQLKPFEQGQQSFHKMSFSSISSGHKPFEYDESAPTSTAEFDQFIFKDIGKGAYIGTKLHEVFENIGMGSLEGRDYSHLYKRFNTFKRINNEETEEINNEGKIEELVQHVWNADINFEGQDPFKIADIDPHKVLNEMEFNFLINGDKKRTELREIINKDSFYSSNKDEVEGGVKKYLFDIKTTGVHSLDGLMNGFMDVFFQHNGKFHILDWKSNYLGNHIDAYSKDNIIKAMNLSNYHLQYLIYTVAAHKYLTKYLDGYDYDKHFGGAIYLFVRGVREGRDTGIFAFKPERKLIEEMAGLMG